MNSEQYLNWAFGIRNIEELEMQSTFAGTCEAEARNNFEQQVIRSTHVQIDSHRILPAFSRFLSLPSALQKHKLYHNLSPQDGSGAHVKVIPRLDVSYSDESKQVRLSSSIHGKKILRYKDRTALSKKKKQIEPIL